MSEIDTETGVSVEEESIRALERMGLLTTDGDGYHAGERFETLMPILRAVDESQTTSEQDHPDSAGHDPPPGPTGDGGDPTGAELVSLVAHDLRGPLSQASGWLALAREDGDEEFFDGVEEALERMAERVEDLVLLASDGPTPTNTERVSVAEMADHVWAELVSDGTTDAGRLVVADDREVVVVPDRLERLLANLFSNALAHGREAGGSAADETERPGQVATPSDTDGGVSTPLTVRIGRLPDGFYVEDDGVGIPTSERDRVFEAGYSTDGGGSGLGLASVAQIAATHGWTVTVTEGTEGGARFEFTGAVPPA